VSVDLLRWAKDVLTDGAGGVNAQLPNVPRDGGEDAPGAVTVVTPLETEWVGRGQIPRDQLVDASSNAKRLLILMLHPDPEGYVAHALPEFDQGSPSIVPLVALFTCRKIEKVGDTTTVVKQIRDGRQTLRAVMRTFAKKFESGNTAFTRNDCEITLPSAPGFILNSQFVEPSADLIVDALVMSYRVLDRWALGVT
jgi:hypothetical protein